MKLNFKKIIADNLGSVVGQVEAKERLAENIIASHEQDGYLSPTGIFGPPGFGKTHLMEAAKGIFKGVWGDARKVIFARSGDELGGTLSFWEDMLLPHAANGKVLFIIDEFHKACKGVQDTVRSMIEITTDRRSKVVRKNDYEIVIDPLKHSFIIGTNKIDEIDDALLSRLDRIDLALFSDDEMEEILFRGVQGLGIRFDDNTMRKIAECNRGSARDIVKWIDAIRRHLAMAGKSTINKADVANIIRKRSTYPMGVSGNELNTLLHLEKHGEQQLKELATKNLCTSTEQNANERYLMQRALITVNVKRQLTQAGREYLAQLRADGFIPKVDKAASIVEIS